MKISKKKYEGKRDGEKEGGGEGEKTYEVERWTSASWAVLRPKTDIHIYGELIELLQ